MGMENSLEFHPHTHPSFPPLGYAVSTQDSAPGPSDETGAAQEPEEREVGQCAVLWEGV